MNVELLGLPQCFGVVLDVRRGLSPLEPNRHTANRLQQDRLVGTAVVGLYFGTGNVQSAVSVNTLQDSSVTNGRNLVGVLWDDSRSRCGEVISAENAWSRNTVRPSLRLS